MMAYSMAAKSHTRTLLSSDPDTTRDPSGENDTENTSPVCPSSVFISSPDDASHTRTLLSHDPDTMRDPSGENDTDNT